MRVTRRNRPRNLECRPDLRSPTHSPRRRSNPASEWADKKSPRPLYFAFLFLRYTPYNERNEIVYRDPYLKSLARLHAYRRREGTCKTCYVDIFTPNFSFRFISFWSFGRQIHSFPTILELDPRVVEQSRPFQWHSWAIQPCPANVSSGPIPRFDRPCQQFLLLPRIDRCFLPNPPAPNELPLSVYIFERKHLGPSQRPRIGILQKHQSLRCQSWWPCL